MSHSESRFNCKACGTDRRGHTEEHPWVGKIHRSDETFILNVIYEEIRNYTMNSNMAEHITHFIANRLNWHWFFGNNTEV